MRFVFESREFKMRDARNVRIFAPDEEAERSSSCFYGVKWWAVGDSGCSSDLDPHRT
jgi:hypothetical protein